MFARPRCDILTGLSKNTEQHPLDDHLLPSDEDGILGQDAELESSAYKGLWMPPRNSKRRFELENRTQPPTRIKTPGKQSQQACRGGPATETSIHMLKLPAYREAREVIRPRNRNLEILVLSMESGHCSNIRNRQRALDSDDPYQLLFFRSTIDILLRIFSTISTCS